MYDQVKGGKRVACYVDCSGCRDICTVDSETLELGARGISYGRPNRYMRFDDLNEKEAFIKMCEYRNVEWLDESGEKDDWSSVEEQLPTESGRYWCYVKELTDLGFSYFQWNCAYNSKERRFSDSTLTKGEQITHWRPLPGAPKG